MDDFAACGGRTEVSLYEYNTICRQDEDWDQIIKDAWDHERAHGEVGLHLARVMDPVAVIEGIFAPTEARLRQFVVNRIGEYDVKYGNEIVDRVRNVTPYRRITIWYWHR